jgi:hypothetical protein
MRVGLGSRELQLKGQYGTGSTICEKEQVLSEEDVSPLRFYPR